MTAASRSLATAPWGALRERLALCYTTSWDTTGPGGDGTNPEQLFAAGYAACFLSAVKLVARTRKLVVANEARVTASVGMGPVTVGYALEVALKISLPNMDRETAQEVIDAAHERCPYSKATRDNIAVTLTLV